ncbi:MAG: hypothetical protein QUS11_06500 [Candidatus Fermentibacter sp.]|nr:hypothetical protein [Candidatus Fermentibacter sp.]
MNYGIVPFDPNLLTPEYQMMLAGMRAPQSGAMVPAPAPTPPIRHPQNPGTVPPGFPQGCPPCAPWQPPAYGAGCFPYPVNPAVAQAQALLQQWQCQQDAIAAARGDRAEKAAKQPQIPLGGRSGSIAAGATGTITLTPTVGICPTGIEIPEFIGSFFLVTSVTSARQELLGNGVGVSAESFRPDAQNLPRRLEFPQMLPGQDMVVTFLNIDAAPHEAFVTLWALPLTQAVPCLA